MSSYRLDVVSASVADAVLNVGGLMFDRIRAGWRVVVVTEDVTQSTALAILGTRAQSPRQPDEMPVKPGRVVRTRIMSGEALCVDRRTSGKLPRTERGSQLLFWGSHVNRELAGTVYPVRHELSPAARRFKACALHAAGLDTHVEPSEMFSTNDALDPDLLADLMLDPQFPAVVSEAQPPSPNLVG